MKRNVERVSEWRRGWRRGRGKGERGKGKGERGKGNGDERAFWRKRGGGRR
jgi:hypothetical protein